MVTHAYILLKCHYSNDIGGKCYVKEMSKFYVKDSSLKFDACQECCIFFPLVALFEHFRGEIRYSNLFQVLFSFVASYEEHDLSFFTGVLLSLK